MKRQSAVVLAGVLLSGCAHQPPPGPPTTLFAMFQKYCLATGGQYEAVDQALTADGFKKDKKGPMAEIMQIKSISWRKGKDSVGIGPGSRYVDDGNGKMVLKPYEPATAKVEDCGVTIERETDDSQAAFARWAAVPAKRNPALAKSIGEQFRDDYNYQIVDGKHVPFVGDWNETAAYAGTWRALVYKRDTEYGVSMSHIYVPKP